MGECGANFSFWVKFLSPVNDLITAQLAFPVKIRKAPPMQAIRPLGVILERLFPWRHTQVVEQIAGEVARQCQSELWQRVGQQTAEMSVAEIRGYVRAHAVGLLEQEVDRALLRRGLNHRLHGRVIDAAVSQLVGMVAHDVLSGVSTTDMKMMAA